jgi:hypothetical protein
MAFKGRPNRGVRRLREIAERLGLSLRTVNTDYKNGIAKLKEIPGAYELILECVQGVDASKENLIRCASVECDKRFIELYGE